MKIAFLYNHSDGMDFSRIEDGNPGVGGTEYNAILLAWYLSRHDKNNEYILLHNAKGIYPIGLENQEVDSLKEALESSSRMGIDYLVMPHWYIMENEDKDLVRRFMIPIVIWTGNILETRLLDFIANCDIIKAVIWVGRQHHDFYIDHRVAKKSRYIYNPLQIQNKSGEVRRIKSSHIVTYMGGLYPAKGFHVLAKMWKDIQGEVPDACLYVCGSGRLYDRSAEMGKYGIAESTYEETFMPYLTDENDNILSSVKFVGVLNGDEKKRLFEQTTVGVVNPTGRSETFCNCAVEMEDFGIPIVTLRKFAYLDTVPNGVGGLTFHTYRGIKKGIIQLLKDKELNYYIGCKAMEYSHNTFELSKCAEGFIDLFDDLNNGKCIRTRTSHYDHVLYDYKWLRILNSTVQLKTRVQTPAISTMHCKLSELKNRMLKLN